MTDPELHLGDVGVSLVLTMTDQAGIPFDVSAATVKKIIIENPAGTGVEKTAVFVTDGTDGKLKYVTIAGDISASGDWRIQARVEFTGGNIFHSAILLFHVFENIAVP